MAKACWREGSKISHDADAVLKHFEAIRKKNGGVITPKAVVDAAKDPDAPDHEYFVWDNSKAGDLYRLEQARLELRAIQIISIDKHGDNEAHIKYIHAGEGYMDRIDVMSNDALREEAIKQVLLYLRSAQKRADEYKELARICAPVGKVIKHIETKLHPPRPTV